MIHRYLHADMRSSRAYLLTAPLVAAALLFPSTADAFERQWHAGVSLGYSYFSAPQEAMHGMGGGLHLTYGVTDALNAMIELDVSTHPGTGVLVGSTAAGIGYVVDILQVVPYVGLLVGPYDVWATASDATCQMTNGLSCHSGRLGVSLPFGLDYTVSRSFIVGVEGRYHLLFLGPDAPEQMVTAFAKAELTWGF